MATTIKASSSKCVPAGATQPNKCQGGWTKCASGIVFKGGDDGSDGSSLTSHTGTNSGISSVRTVVSIYGPIAAQSISGTVTATIRGKAAVFTNLYKASTAVYIMKPCGVKRATLKARTNFGTCWTTTLADYTSSALSMCTQSSQAGDYLVMEAGFADTCFLCNDTGTVQNGSTGPHTRWVFSGTIQLQKGHPGSLMLMGVGT